MKLIKLTIELPGDDVPGLEEFMRARNIRFDPRAQVTATRDSFLSETTITGEDALETAREINEYLRDMGISDQVRTDHDRWSLEELQQFLEFAINDFNWEDGKLVGSWWDTIGDHKGWEEYARLFVEAGAAEW